MYEKFNLKGNPFKNNIPKPVLKSKNKLVWAGLEKIKNKLNLYYDRALTSNHKQIILNWGPYGGGKTFSADYFINYIDFDLKNLNFTQIYLRSPKTGNIAGSELYKNILDYLSFSDICSRVNTLIKEYGDEALFKIINSRIKSEEFTKSLILLGNEDRDILETMRRYVYSGLNRTELKELLLARNIETNSDNVKFMAGILTLYTITFDKKDSRVIFWLDELEDLIYYSQKEYRAFSQILRDLFDTLVDNFTVFLNFTFSEPQDDTIELLLGGAIWSRINAKIRFKELNEEDATIYIKQLLRFYQINKTENFSPFTEDLILQVLGLIPKSDLTPRSINKLLGDLLDFALENDYKLNEEAYVSWFESKYID
ncbi:hypothetical protein KAU33_11260 [Candidatus Dependentiae bacterium]|nr:hypothetical protein [Candidatus Dependentiae bacterium]